MTDKSKGEPPKTERKPEEKRDEVEGEGSYTATRAYDQATTAFAQSGRVEEAAKKAERALESPDERKEMEAAERVGKAKSRGEDPALSRKATPSR